MHVSLILASLIVLGAIDPSAANAQAIGGPPAPVPAPAPVPSLPPGPLGATFSPERFHVTSAANEKGTFLWIVDAIQRQVTLCEKTIGDDFVCKKKVLPP